MKKSAKILLICVICVQIHSFLFAQIDTTKHFEIKEITISASPKIEVFPAQKLTGKELQNLSSHSVADAIRYFSGIQIKDFGGIGGLKTVDIRSMGSNHVGVFYDGVQLGNAQNGTVDLGKFSLDNIEEISLYHGQKSELLQSAKDFGAAGTLYLTTRRPTFEVHKNYNIRTTFRTGSFGLANPSVLWEQKISKNISSSLNAEYLYATGKYKFRYRRVFPDGTVAYDTTARRENGGMQAFRIEGGVFGNAKKLTWNLKAYLYNSARSIPGAIVNNNWHSAAPQWDRNFFTQASLSAPLHRRYALLAHIKYANDYLRYQNDIFKQQEFYTCLSNKVNILKKWDISLATDFQWNNLASNIKNFSPPNRYTALVALATAFEVWRIKTMASVLGTIIYDKIDRSGFIITPPEDSQPSTFFRHALTPAVFISCKPMKKEEFHIRAFYKQIFRMPTFNDLYYTEIGSNTLRPEFATQYNLGLQYTKVFNKGILEMIMGKTDAYYNIVKDKIVAIPRKNTLFHWMMMNIGLVKICGIDAVAQLNWKCKYDIRWQTRFNYTYQKARDFSDPTDNDPVAGTYKSQIAYIPWHNGSVSLQFSYKTYQLNYCFIYVGERYHNSSNIRENYEPPWYTHDLSLGKEFCFKKWKFLVSAEINNILNQQFEVVLGYPMPGTNVRVILKFEI